MITTKRAERKRGVQKIIYVNINLHFNAVLRELLAKMKNKDSLVGTDFFQFKLDGGWRGKKTFVSHFLLDRRDKNENLIMEK